MITILGRIVYANEIRAMILMLPGQTERVQIVVSMSSPVQLFPPYCGAGFEQ